MSDFDPDQEDQILRLPAPPVDLHAVEPPAEPPVEHPALTQLRAVLQILDDRQYLGAEHQRVVSAARRLVEAADAMELPERELS